MKLVKKSTPNQLPELDYELLNRLCDRAFYYALNMIHVANHRPEVDKGEPKVGGHPSACASSKHILAAIHLVLRRPEDYFAFKPHLSPMDHAYNYMMEIFRDSNGRWLSDELSEKAMHHLRHYSKEGLPVFQSYHAEADPDGYRYFPSGSVGIPPVNALYTSLAYAYAKDHGFEIQEDPTFWCLMGDSEFREGSLAEAMPDAGERQLGNLVWIVDYNRQNLDGTRVLNEDVFDGSDADRMVRIAAANGWNTFQVKHGSIRERLFSQPGGEEFRRVLDEELSDFEMQALITANRAQLTREVLESKSKQLKNFLKGLKDAELQEAFLNLGGHDLEKLVEVLGQARRKGTQPSLVVAYTIKGHGLSCQAMSGNHSALPELSEIQSMGKSIKASVTEPFERFSSSSEEGTFLKSRCKSLRDGMEFIQAATDNRRQDVIDKARAFDWPVDFDIQSLKLTPMAHSQWMWGQIAAKLSRLAHGTSKGKESLNDLSWSPWAKFFLTMAPDVGSSTNTSPNMTGKLYGEVGQDDFELKYETKDKTAPDVIPHRNESTGHIRFEIAEGNCMSAAGSFGKMSDLTGIPFYPAMTIYDFFIKRAHDQFYYNLYWRSRFTTMGTPSGVTLAPEGAQHSWKSDFQIPHCVTWEPCFAKELEWILADTLRRHFCHEPDGRESQLIRCVTKGLPQREMIKRLKTQKRFMVGSPELDTEVEVASESIDEGQIWETIRQEVLLGAYPLIDYRGYVGYVPGDNVVHLFAMGALGMEAIKASDELLKQGIFANVFIVTSPDLLLGNFAEENGYEHLRETLSVSGDLFVHLDESRQLSTKADWYAIQASRVPVVSVHDGEPGLLDNIGSVVGVKQICLAVRKTSKSGTTPDVFDYHGISAPAISEACVRALEKTADERFVVSSEILKSLN